MTAAQKDNLAAALTRLIEQPRIGERLEEFEPRDVRRLLIGRDETCYEIRQCNLRTIHICLLKKR